MRLEGLLVDLVPYDRRFSECQYQWINSETGFWGSAGDRFVRPRTRFTADYDEFIEAVGRGGGAEGLELGIQAKDGTPLGDIGANFISPTHRTANIGASIGDPAYWGGGYGTDALLLYLDYVFNWLDLRKVWLGTMSINARVQRQMQKVGFTLEARSRSAMYADGQWVDELTYGLLREEWPGRPALIEKLGLRALTP